MSSAQKIIQAAAGNAAGEGLYVEDVFSTYLYEGTSATQTITNGVDLDGEGGLVWIKPRTSANNHKLVDTERGNTKELESNTTSAESTRTNGITSFNSNGFTLGASPSYNDATPATDYVSWTFRKAPKFFDVVTYTGTGTSQAISHNLGSAPGCLMIKRTDSASNWFVYHRGLTSAGYGVNLNTTAAQSVINWFNFTAPTSTQFLANGDANTSGGTYVAYLFAHNDGDGEFGEDADQDIIKCGSYTGTGSNGTVIDLGFEPQWLLVKNADAASNWCLVDNMRGVATGGVDEYLRPNTTNAGDSTYDLYDFHATGFEPRNNYSLNNAANDYIYIAIRRGPMKTPESGAEVFAIDTRGATGGGTPPALRSGFPVDWVLWRNNKNTSASTEVYTRMLASYLITNTTAAEVAYSSSPANFAFNNGWFDNTATDSNDIAWMFRRAPGFFDVVAYTGTGTEPRTVYHNLGVAPEMIWTKRRDSGSLGWVVWHKDLTTNTWLRLDSNQAETSSPAAWGGTFSADNYTIANDPYDAINGSGNLIAYLFATLPGVSKVGSFSHTNGSTTDVDCGFTNGARFVLIKRTSATGPWALWDSERGIVSGTEKYLALDSTAAETDDGGTDYIDPLSSGFQMTGSLSTADYIFLAIA